LILALGVTGLPRVVPMKTLLQTVIALAVLVGGIGVFSYMSQYTRKPPVVKPNPGPIGEKNSGKLTQVVHVPAKVAQWDFFDETYSEAFEVGAKGHYDYWFSNANPVPVEVTLSAQGCTCSEVQVGFIPAAETAKWRRRMSQYACVDVVDNLLGLPDLASAIAAAVGGPPEVKPWHTFPQPKVGKRTYICPAADPEAGPQLGIIRLKWEVKDAQPRRLTATVEYRAENMIEDYPFEAPIRGVAPLMVSTAVVQIGELGYNEVRDIGFYCFSATKPSLNVQVEEATPDPCVVINQPRPLSEQEIAELPDKVSLAGLRMKCAFFVGGKVYERKDGNQLDLGPLNRNIRVRSGTDIEQVVALQGTVRSAAITVGEGGERGRIDLGSFRAAGGIEKKIVLSSTDPAMKLKLVGHSPETFNVTLEEQQSSRLPKRWDLTVGVDPKKGFSGLMQHGSIVLEIVGDQPRKIRIPVTGNATY